MITLYSYWRSSAAYRVRIALNLKGLPYETIPVHLVRDGGEQHQEAYLSINPSELVPTLAHDDLVLNQSMAIIEYLDDICPQPLLLPGNHKERAIIKAFALDVACDIHPLNNLRVLQHLKSQWQGNDETTANWYRHWLAEGFKGLEIRANKTAGAYCFGNHVTLADVVLIPQIYNAHRYKLDMSQYPTLQRLYDQCCANAAFEKAAPENQPDAGK